MEDRGIDPLSARAASALAQVKKL
jgi:hypothetical protein